IIRSARIAEGVMDLFAGVGITIDSDPEAEWQEIEHKLKLFI
ncbi:MAG: chorismate binding enzyme, partial [Chlamydiota bacterium]